MRAQAKAPWIAHAFQSMLQSNKEAANILYQHQCIACTDITGFGLMGHILEMMKSSSLSIQDHNNETDETVICNLDEGSFSMPGVDIGITLNLTAIPTLCGAEESIALGLCTI